MGKILLLGDFYGNNPGDVVIESVTKKWLKPYGDTYFDMYSYMTFMLKQDVKKPNLPKDLEAIVLCGGNLVAGDWLPGYFEMALSNPSVKKLMIGTGIMPVHPTCNWSANKYFGLFDYISVRDKFSADNIKQINPDVNVDVACDVAFDLSFRRKRRKIRKKYITVSIIPQKWGQVGVVFMQKLKSALNKIKESTDLDIIIVPYNHTWESNKGEVRAEDGAFADAFFSNFEILNTKDWTFDQLYHVISHAELHIGNRYHSCISAALANVPFIGIDSKGANKIQGICSDLKMPNVAPSVLHGEKLDDIIQHELDEKIKRKRTLTTNLFKHRKKLGLMKDGIKKVFSS